MSILVVTYSRTGHTATMGREIACLLDADLEELKDTRRRTGLIGFLRAGLDARQRRMTVLRPLDHDPARYDLVLVGTPVWASSMSSPIRTFLHQNGDKLRQVGFFLTDGGAAHQAIFQQMEALCRRAPIATVAVRGEDIDSPEGRALIEGFVQAVRGRAPGWWREPPTRSTTLPR